MKYLVLICLFANLAHADILKSSPGELAASHAGIDDKDKCTLCHDENDNSITASKCLGCHDHADMKRRIDSGDGLHNSATVKGRPCTLCHKEHRGRGFDLMGWQSIGDPSKFDHKLAGWPLDGKHASVTCTKCHTTTNRQGLRTYLGTDKSCNACHAKEQPHGQVRPALLQCNRCHTASVWKPAKTTLDFDHNNKNQAAMPLEGAHADVACAKCHTKAQFKLPKFDGGCEQCHNSPHDGQLFSTKKCAQCHSPALRSMKEIRFDHKKDANYALLGKHANLKCETCHTKAMGKKKPTAGCENCHSKDNKHGKRFDKFPACATCHAQTSWKGSMQFNHQSNTGFALTGKHATTTCRTCHRGGKPDEFEKFEIKNGCMSCHRHEKAHGGKFKNDQCLTCHEEGGSKKLKRETALEVYHGETSKFPLHNGHANVQCSMCHVNDVYQETPLECGVSCHEDSLHKGTLGDQCSRCHEPGKWEAVRFDHKDDTKYPLVGKHADIKTCDGCHPGRVYKPTKTDCASCHKRDDVHQGKLGDKCEGCHDTAGTVLFRHNRDAKFKLENAHAPLVCASCHKSIEFKPVRTDCNGCHAEPAVHKGKYGTDCERCHSTKKFDDIKAIHDVGDFSLSGAHDQVECAKCHPSGEKLRGSGNLCIECHKKDDIHNNSLSPRCGECHTQRSFAPARFDHLSVGCALMGLHQTLPCADCHKSGNYGAVSPLCVSCHRNDALRVKQPDHRGFPPDCGSCHNPSAWIPATQLGPQSICR